jgi:hypothetical protein
LADVPVEEDEFTVDGAVGGELGMADAGFEGGEEGGVVGRRDGAFLD